DPKLTLAVVAGVSPLALAGKRHAGLSFYNPRAFGYRGDRGDKARASLYACLNHQSAGTIPQLEYVTHTAVTANAASDKVRELARRDASKAPYPATALGRSLQAVASLIAGK